MDKETKKIWDKYRKNRDRKTRNVLVEKYIYIVPLIVNNINNPYFDYDDMVGYGMLGLIDAVERFNPEKGAKFTTYASIRIRGYILDKIRENDFGGRTLRNKERKIKKAKEFLIEQNIELTPQNIADKLGISLEAYEKILYDIEYTSLYYIESFKNDDGECAIELCTNVLSPEELYYKKETIYEMHRAFLKLSKKEQTIINYFYFENLNKTQIGKIMCLSPARVSQIHEKAIKKLNQYLKNKNIEYNIL